MAGMPAAFGSENNQDGGVNYYPNDCIAEDAPAPDTSVTEPPMPILGEAWLRAYDTQDDDNFSQAGDLFRLMSDDQKDQLTSNITDGLSHANASIQERMLAQFNAADINYATRIKAKLNP